MFTWPLVNIKCPKYLVWVHPLRCLLGACWLRLAALLWSSNRNTFFNLGSLILPSNLRVLLKSYMVSFKFLVYGLSRSSVNRLVVVCSERCLADDTSMDCIYFLFFLSLYSECLLLSSPSLSFSFWAFFSSLNSSFMDVYLSLTLSSFSLVCSAACSLEMQAG